MASFEEITSASRTNVLDPLQQTPVPPPHRLAELQAAALLCTRPLLSMTTKKSHATLKAKLGNQQIPRWLLTMPPQKQRKTNFSNKLKSRLLLQLQR